ncbi:EAL domain-containing protein [Guyparkeria sp. SB14A]|uniref:EAL domain-containing protein n=1 Tax=Guyparkeria sp. SB14A TaxID=2571147 RepID=UPI0010AC93E4|nr:EAL domain-containing protein [Guyparkeria sp. SB14A]TKA91208.1 EAL domain-containing protein [Guyparkeria sp. SB14A]
MPRNGKDWLQMMSARVPGRLPINTVVPRLLVAAIVCLAVIVAGPAEAQSAGTEKSATPIHVGVLAYAGKDEAINRWQATADYLSERNPGYRFEIVPLFLSELRHAFVQGRLDFVLTQSLQYSELSRLGAIWPLATLVVRGNGGELEQFGAVVFTRQGTGFAALDDLVGTRIAGTSPNALGGWLLGMQALENAGLDVEHEITPIFTGLPLEAVVDAVLDGRAHAGVVRASFFQRYLEAYPDSRLIPVGEAKREGFPYPSNTPLVPEWPFAATERAPDGLAARVARQLIAMPAQASAAEQARIAGWRTPLDYSIVDRLHDKWLPDPVSLGSLLRHFWHYLVLILAVVLALFAWQARRATRRLGAEKRRLRRAFSGLHTGAVLTDTEGRILLTNHAVEAFAHPELTGQLAGRAFCDAFNLQIDGLSPQCAFGDLVERVETRETQSIDGVIERDNQRLDVNVKISRLEAHGDEGDSQLLVSMLDVTDLRSANALLTYRATHDRLTGVLNREAMEEFLSQAMPGKTPRNEPTHASCLVWIDLDEFRLLNEIGSRELGDRILASLASHFSLELPSDAVLARMGVDEFVIWMPLSSRDTCTLVAREVLEIIHAFRLPDEHEHLRLKASVGVTRIDSDDLLASRRLEDAERACQSAQRLGGDRVVQFSGEDTELLEREQQIERYNALRAAIAEDRLDLAAQRIAPVDPARGVIHEMLLRVTDADGRMRFPSEYIEIAEKHHAMGEIDRWVIRQSCRWLSQQPAEAGTVSINLSGHSVQDPEMLEFIRQALGESGVDPARVIFEITETAAILNLDQAERLIGAMRRIGCRFALDDFGGGFLSFEYLRRLNPDIVKIDGRLIDDLSHDPVAAVIVAAIAQVSRVMGAQTVAEWVETDDQYDKVIEVGVDYVQGFLLHRPTPLTRP